MSEGYTENDTNAGYQESYMGGAVQKQIGEQKKSEKKKMGLSKIRKRE